MKAAYDVAADQLISRCRELALCTEIAGETTRLHLCQAMSQVHARLRAWMQEADLTVRLDAAGNLRGMHTPDAKVGAHRRLLIGSHLDTVPNAGAFDGVLGVLLGLSAIALIREEALPYAIELIGFAEEEGIRFGRPFLGSLALIGELGEEVLALRDHNGTTLRESLQTFGTPLHEMRAAELSKDGSIIGFLEAHIEQGPVLDGACRALGVVHTIAGQTRARLQFLGQGNHAGTTPMSLRRDALAAAAAWVVDVEQHARATAGLVATVGKLTVEPGAPNVIPSRVTATLDVRHADDTIRSQAVKALITVAAAQARERGVELQIEVTLEQHAVSMDSHLSTTLERAAQRDNVAALSMVSGAGHDAMVLARRVPAAMLFLRSPRGVSHHPDESVLLPDVAAALEATVRFLRMLGDDEISRMTDEG